MIDPTECTELIEAAHHNFRAGEIGVIRYKSSLAAYGMTATEIDICVNQYHGDHVDALKRKTPSVKFVSGLPDREPR